jgi:excisionase family DNA binding protein
MVKAPSDILTLPQAARLAGLSPITLRVQIRNGRIKATKVGRDWVVTRAELRAYLESVGR